MMSQNRMTKQEAAIALLIILGLGILVKPFFWRIELAGNFASYQAVFGMIAKRYLASNFSNVLRPEIFLIENARPSLELIFFPLVSLLAALLTSWFGGLLDAWGRLVSVLACAVSGWVLYRMLRMSHLDRSGALLGVFIFTFSPLVWVYGRNFQNEALAFLFLSTAFFLIDRFNRRGERPLLVFSALFFGLSVILRVHFGLLGLGIFFWLNREKRIKSFVLWLLLSAVLPVVWYSYTWWLEQHIDHVHTSLFIQLRVGKTFPNPLLLDPIFYRFLFQNMWFWVGGPLAIPLALIGIAKWPRQDVARWIAFVVLSLLIPILIPKKFMDQHFYIFPLVLPFAGLSACGLKWVRARFGRPALFAFLSFSFFGSLAIAWKPAFDIGLNWDSMRHAAEFIRKTSAPKDWVIAGHDGSNLLLYYSERLGWDFAINPQERSNVTPYMALEGVNQITGEAWRGRNEAYLDSISWLEYLREKGAKFFYTVTRDELEKNLKLLIHLTRHYKVISSSSDPFYAFRLAQT